MPDRVGQQIGNYRLKERLGKGGFAEVYLGQHVHLSTKQAAIKILHLLDVDVKQFQYEAETTAKLDHPHIVKLLDFAPVKDTPFLVLDYAPGGSLRRRHPKESIVSLDTVTGYLKQIAPALQYAHDLHILHRDIKPDNILIGRQGELLLSDFGIAMLSQTGRTSLEAPYAPEGTPLYMAPEMFRGKPEKGSDQYSLAVMVYEWLCGTAPFSKGGPIEVGYQHTHEPVPSLREKNPDISLTVEAVIMKALAKEPHDRFASITEFAKAFEQAVYDEQNVSTLKSDNPLGTSVPPKSESRPAGSSSPESGRVGAPPVPRKRKASFLFPLGVVFVLVIGSMISLFLVDGGIRATFFPASPPTSTHTSSQGKKVATPTQVPTPTPTPNMLLTAQAGYLDYHDALNSSSTSQQKALWQIVGTNSRCTFEPDGYHVPIMAQGFAICHEGRKAYQDFTLSIDMALNGDRSVTGGLLFRDQDALSGSGAYFFELNTLGQYKISIVTQNRVLQDWTHSSAIHPGNKIRNTLQVIAFGHVLYFYINGVFLIQKTDGTFSDGGISLACYNDGEAIFSNLYIYLSR